MRLLCHLFNHNFWGKRSLDDVIGIFGHQLRALGHWCVHDPNNESGSSIQFLRGPGEYNIIIEGFTQPVIDLIAHAHAGGARFICLATEEPTDKGFNHGTQKEMVMRQEMFPLAAKYMEGILHLVPGERVNNWYSQFAPTAYVELGYAPTFVRRETQAGEPPYEFGFFGSLTPRREKILRTLAKMTRTKNAIRVVADFCSQEVRDEAMQQAKVILQLRKFEEMGLVSSSRCNTALSCGRPVIAEPHDITLSKPWDEIVKFTPTPDVFLLTALTARHNWRELHREQFQKFKTRLTPEVCVGAPLRKIGITPDGVAQRVAA